MARHRTGAMPWLHPVVTRPTVAFMCPSASVSLENSHMLNHIFWPSWHASDPPLRWLTMFNTLRLRQDGRHFADDIFKCIFLNENALISIEISLKFIPKGPIDNIPALVQIMAWRRLGDKPLYEPMMVSLLTHICVTRPQWVQSFYLQWLNPCWIFYAVVQLFKLLIVIFLEICCEFY